MTSGFEIPEKEEELFATTPLSEAGEDTHKTINRDSEKLLLHGEENFDISRHLESFDEQNDEDVNDEFTRFTESFDPVDYGEEHPFEVLRRRRTIENSGEVSNISAEEEEGYQRFLKRHLSPWDANSDYRPIRIHLDTAFLVLAEKDYGPQVAYLKSVLLPNVKEVWERALRVYPVLNNIVVTSGNCPISASFQNTTGVPDSDIVIFIAANIRSICGAAAEPFVAATSCQYDGYDRPIVGRATVCLQDFDASSTRSVSSLYKLLVHGFAHILGFSHRDYQFFYDPSTGKPRTPRPFIKERVTCVDGGQQLRVVPSENTLQSGFTSRNLRYFEIVTPAVRTIARNQFDCQNMNGARLENQPTNNGNCFGSHWEAVSSVS